jgi:hypothetical protein
MRTLHAANSLVDLPYAESRLIDKFYTKGVFFFDIGSGLKSNFELITRLDLYLFH